jgi:alpha-beta hydrolase superfamily lysophospholipase
MGGDGRVRRARTMAAMCTAIGMGAMMLAPLARPARATPTEGGESTAVAERSLEVGERITEGEARAVFYAPQNGAASPRPVTVLLHGLCGDPRRACEPFVSASTERGWLVCPRGEDSCGGGARWRLRPDDDERRVEESLQALARERTGQVDVGAPRILVGFSLGGIAAVRIAQSAPLSGVYSGLVVIASQVRPDAALLRKAGVKRVVLAAGDLDLTSAPLRDDARRLELEGLPTRFVSLGHFGHGYPADMEERMREPMAWVAGGQDGS